MKFIQGKKWVTVKYEFEIEVIVRLAWHGIKITHVPIKVYDAPAKDKKRIRVDMAGNKKRVLTVYEEEAFLRGYGNTIRQISITGHKKIKPAIIITNDLEMPADKIIRK